MMMIFFGRRFIFNLKARRYPFSKVKSTKQPVNISPYTSREASSLLREKESKAFIRRAKEKEREREKMRCNLRILAKMLENVLLF